MMRVCFVITDLAFGGAETQVVALAKELSRRKHEVFLISMLPPVAFVDELSAFGIKVFSLDMKRGFPNPLAILNLWRILSQLKPDIIHSHMIHANILSRVTGVFYKRPVLICTAHSLSEKGRHRSENFRVFLYRITDSFCDLTTQVSPQGVERYKALRAVNPNKILYVPNGVDTEKFKPDVCVRDNLRKEFGLSESFVWIAVGRFDPPKDYHNMLTAFSIVLKQESSANLVIVGDGPLRPLMESFAKEMGIKDKVLFLGIREDVGKLLNVADGFVLSSEWEGLPLVLLEAASTGLPIVATNVGGNAEVVIDGETGFLVPPKDPIRLSEAMLRLMKLPKSERLKMGFKGRDHVIQNFSLQHIVDIWEELYRLLLSKRHRT